MMARPAALRQVALTMQRVWESFFNRTFEVAEEAYTAGLLTREDVELQEAFIFLGLPALTILEIVAAGGQEGTVRFSIGTVSEETCPDGGREIFAGLLQARAAYENLTRAAPEGQLFLWHSAVKRRVLYVEAPEERREALPVALEEVECNRFCGMLQALATGLSRRDIYRNHFHKLLELLLTLDVQHHGAWSSTATIKFFEDIQNLTFDVTESALLTKHVSTAELHERPEWLRVGVFSLLAFHTALRSAGLPQGQVLLSEGEVVSRESCPERCGEVVRFLIAVRNIVELDDGLPMEHCSAASRAILRWGFEGSASVATYPAVVRQRVKQVSNLLSLPFCLDSKAPGEELLLWDYLDREELFKEGFENTLSTLASLHT